MATTTVSKAAQTAARDQTQAQAADLQSKLAASRNSRGGKLAPIVAVDRDISRQQISSGLKAAGLPADTDLNPDQRDRAAAWPKGLRNGALATYILEGKTMANQVAEAQMHRETAEAAAAFEKKSAAATKAAQTRVKPAKAAKPVKVAKYTDDVRAAVKLAKIARGTQNGAPGPKQHMIVRNELGLDATVEQILEAAGVKSVKALRSLAAGDSTKDELKALRPLGDRFSDSFCKGRNLAGMLAAWVEQLAAANKSAKSPAKAKAPAKAPAKVAG